MIQSGLLGLIPTWKAGQQIALQELLPELSSTFSYCLLMQKVAFEAYVPFSNVWKFAWMLAQFPELEISFFPVVLGIVQKKEK